MEFLKIWGVSEICNSEKSARKLNRFIAKKLREKGYKVSFYRKGKIAIRATKHGEPQIITGYKPSNRKRKDGDRNYLFWDNGDYIRDAPDWFYRKTQYRGKRKSRLYASPKPII